MSRLSIFLGKQFNVENDNMGIPSIIDVEGEKKSLIQSIDRKHMLVAMKSYLIKEMYVPENVAESGAQEFIDVKYKEYMDFVMNL